jgi:hypothetical protein
LIADLLIEKCFNKASFSWGGNNLSKQGEARKLYLKALQEADENNYSKLTEFARA